MGSEDLSGGLGLNGVLGHFRWVAWLPAMAWLGTGLWGCVSLENERQRMDLLERELADLRTRQARTENRMDELQIQLMQAVRNNANPSAPSSPPVASPAPSDPRRAKEKPVGENPVHPGVR